MAPPPTFIDLATAYDRACAPGAFVNIIGIVVDLMEPKRTRTGSFMTTFKLIDERLRDSIYGSQGLTVRFFSETLDMVPKVRNIGDVMLLTTIKMMLYSERPIALSNYSTRCLVFPTAGIPTPEYSISYLGNKRIESFGAPFEQDKLDLIQQAYVIHLKHEFFDLVRDKVARETERQSRAPPMPIQTGTMNSWGKKFRLITDIRHDTFADLGVQVVKKFANQRGDVELYVTDYTANKDMFRYAPPEEQTENRDGDDFGHTNDHSNNNAWPGPYGWLVLRVHTKGPHATFANALVKVGDFVLLRNVKCRMAPENKLEGWMWPDGEDSQKVQIRPQRDQTLPEIAALLQRKQRYWASRPQQPKPIQPDAAAANAAGRNLAGNNQSTDGPTAPKLSKKARKRQNRAELVIAEAAKATPTTIQPANPCNKHVRSSNQHVPLTRIRDILDPENKRHTNEAPGGKNYVIPFINAKYRARVRVVDFEPKDLVDFAVPVDNNDDSGDMEWAFHSQRFEWYFSLTLEDASDTTPGVRERMVVHVQHAGAQFLFGKDMEDPVDLRLNASVLGKLREKLCILWGNLEEKEGRGEVKNLPFECCMFEYGIEMNEDDPDKATTPFGWLKMFQLEGTTIL